MKSFTQQHLPKITSQLYAKHKDNHPSKIGKGFFTNAFLGASNSFQPADHL